MQRADFHYELPESLIAQHPPARRSGGRLLRLLATDDTPADLAVTDLPRLLEPGDLLVCNDTRVVPARLGARKSSGGAVEFLLERKLDAFTVLAQLRASKSPRAGAILDMEGGARAEVVGREDNFFRLRFDVPVGPYLSEHGHVPLPPYIARGDSADDRERYQTVFARAPGSVACPTAGLHFDASLLQRIESDGVKVARLTLHVGAGTFQPVRVDNPDDHRMHAERVVVDESLCRAVRSARSRNGRVVAVGTTSVRALESAAASGSIQPMDGETKLFIYPGYRFRVVDAMLTNFHLPESTLLMLVAAFAGRDRVLNAYRHAVREKYRFFSYGDAMFLERFRGIDHGV